MFDVTGIIRKIRGLLVDIRDFEKIRKTKKKVLENNSVLEKS